MRTLGIAFGLMLVGCSSNNPTPVDAGAEGGSPDGEAGAPLAFSSCTLLSDPSKPPVGPQWDGISAAMAECATTQMPAVWSEPGGDPIDVFVKRYPATMQPAKAQLWLLEGGPGGAGSDFETTAFFIGKNLPGVDIYMPDHRGTGNSSFATCSAAAAGLGGISTTAATTCAKGTSHLDGLTVTGAARDLAALIDSTRSPSQQVFIYGISYGTYWAQRYLLIRPEQPTAVVLDSVVPMDGFDFANFDAQMDDRTRALLELCKADATCTTKLGADPLATAKQAIAAIDGGMACTVPPNLLPIRALFGNLIDNGHYFERMLIPAFIYRILRCNAQDQTWFSQIVTYLSMPRVPPVRHTSLVVSMNIMFSELWPGSPTRADLETKQKSMIAFAGWDPNAASIASIWPRYGQDMYFAKWPSSPAPTLVLQGTLDPNTPFGSVVKPHYSGANQYFVEVPLANHGVAYASLMKDPMAPPCGWQIMKSFLTDSSKAPDTSCIAGMAPLDYGSPPPDFLMWVGIKDLFENP